MLCIRTAAGHGNHSSSHETDNTITETSSRKGPNSDANLDHKPKCTGTHRSELVATQLPLQAIPRIRVRACASQYSIVVEHVLVVAGRSGRRHARVREVALAASLHVSSLSVRVNVCFSTYAQVEAT